MATFSNAVLAKELRSRMRIWKTPALITLYVLLVGLVGWAVIAAMTEGRNHGVLMEPEAGFWLYTALAMFQLGLITLVAPALTVAQVSGERDRQTFDLLLTTRMSSFGIVFGKFASALALMLLLIVASMPVYGLVFLFGGVSLKHIAVTFLIFIAVTMLHGALGLWASVVFRRTAAAVVGSYLIVLFFVLGTVILQAIWFEMFPSPEVPPGQLPPPRIPYLNFFNPLVAIASSLPGPASEVVRMFGMGDMYYRYPVQPLPMPVPPGGVPGAPVIPTAPQLSAIQQFFLNTQPWVVYLLFAGIASLLLITLAVLNLSPVRPWTRWRVRRQQARALTHAAKG